MLNLKSSRFRARLYLLAFEFAQFCNRAAPAFGAARLADVAAKQDQPVMRADPERLGHTAVEQIFYCLGRLALGEPVFAWVHRNAGADRAASERDDFRLSTTFPSPFQGEAGWGCSTRASTRCAAPLPHP